jgi:tetratricopeptide (TPR) repeat protein
VTRLGPYRLDDEAMDESGLQAATHVATRRRVSVQWVPHTLTAHPRDRFELGRGITAACRLEHSGILRILDHGVTQVSTPNAPAGSHYLVYEHHDAGTLVSVSGPRTWAKTRAILLSVLDALAYAHSFGVVHGHLDPNKVVFVQTSEGIFAKIMGLAMGEIFPSSQEFAAPERLAHPDFKLMPEHDLFSVGRICEELLRTNLTTAESNRLDSELPKELNSWLAKLITVDSIHRFGSAGAAARKLATMEAAPQRDVMTFMPTLGDDCSILSFTPPRQRSPILNPHLDSMRERLPNDQPFVLRVMSDALAQTKDTGRVYLVRISSVGDMDVAALVVCATRLLSERFEAQVLTIQPEDHSRCNSGLTEAIQQDLRPNGAALETILARLDQIGPLEPCFARALISLCEEPDDDPLVPFIFTVPGQRHLAMIEWLRVRALVRPQIIVMQDVHQEGDAASLLQRLITLATPFPLLIIAILAKEDPIDTRDLSTASEFRDIEVPSLEPESATRYMDALLIPPHLAEAVLLAAKGESRSLREYAYEIACGRSAPDSLTAMYTERLRLLTLEHPDADTALEIAAALGTSVVLTEWEMACGLARISFDLTLVQALVEQRFAQYTPKGWRFETSSLHAWLQHRSQMAKTWTHHNKLALRVLEVRYDPPLRSVAARAARYAIESDSLESATQYTLRSIQGLVKQGRTLCARELIMDCLAMRRRHQVVDSEITVELWLAQGATHSGLEAARWWLQRGVNRANREGWDSLRMGGAAALSKELLRCGDPEFERYAQEAAELALKKPSGLDIKSELELIDLLLHCADTSLADRLLHRFEAWVSKGRFECVYRMLRCRAAIHRRNWPQAKELAKLAATEAEVAGDFETLAHALVLQARCAFQANEHDHANAYYRRANEVQKRIGASTSVSSFGLGVMAAGRGDLPHAVRLFHEACSLGSDADVDQTRIMRGVGLLWVAVLREDIETVKLEIHQLKGDFLRTHVHWLDLALILEFAASSLASTSPADAREVDELAARIYEASGDSNQAYFARSRSSRRPA